MQLARLPDSTRQLSLSLGSQKGFDSAFGMMYYHTEGESNGCIKNSYYHREEDINPTG
jgi:hypothetical protein